MAEFPALPLWTDAYLGDTTHLTTLEHGAYLLLLMAAWRSKTCSLPHDDKLLARYARLTPAQWKRIKPIIMEFYVVEGDQLIQQRLRDEIILVKQRSNSAKKNIRARWLKTNKTDDTPVYDPYNGRNTTTTTPISNSIKGVSSGEDCAREAMEKEPPPKIQKLSIVGKLRQVRFCKTSDADGLYALWCESHEVKDVVSLIEEAVKEDHDIDWLKAKIARIGKIEIDPDKALAVGIRQSTSRNNTRKSCDDAKRLLGKGLISVDDAKRQGYEVGP